MFVIFFVLQIPYIRRAAQLVNVELKLLASAWSPPVWMKTIENLTAPFSFLKPEYYQLWADYYIKFFEAYAANNITFWSVTTQNEPATGYNGVLNTLAWTVDQLVKYYVISCFYNYVSFLFVFRLLGLLKTLDQLFVVRNLQIWIYLFMMINNLMFLLFKT